MTIKKKSPPSQKLPRWFVFHDSGMNEGEFNADVVAAKSAMDAVKRVHERTHGSDPINRWEYYACLVDEVSVIKAEPPTGGTNFIVLGDDAKLVTVK